MRPWYLRVLLSFCSAILSTCLLSIFEAASYSQDGCWFLAIILNPSSEEKDLEKHKRGMNANWVNSFSGNSTIDWKWHLIGNSYLCTREAGNKIFSWAFFHERENQERKGEWVLAEQPAFSATTGEYTLAKWVCRFSFDWGGISWRAEADLVPSELKICGLASRSCLNCGGKASPAAGMSEHFLSVQARGDEERSRSPRWHASSWKPHLHVVRVSSSHIREFGINRYPCAI